MADAGNNDAAVLPNDVAQAEVAAKDDQGPIGVWLRDYIKTNGCTIDEALSALRVAKPTLRTYQLSFRSICRCWITMAKQQWNSAWDVIDASTLRALVSHVKSDFVPLADDGVSI